ncbi:sugar transferase [Haloechinothrix sp. YIM 98757]|uniref:Sugar transferase n=1 Tax=Haloechinothrix aidingensis TaxID=2752311 RepID=A0A837ZY28_9PSEU|nr:sugar transferase [Haloechinothrix aidingensis]MBA0125074.1 sugar transferase [Haloechinothrix aidingensis]
MDLVLGTVLAVLATPAILVLAAVLGARMRQWPFFRHYRIGHNGSTVMFPKLRTLSKRTAPYALKNGGEVIPVDRFCAFLRRRHLDELPQLWLVPLFKLSLVGPRPKMPDAWEPTHPGYRDARCLVRQGCTGLWQIGHERDHLVHERPAYDFCYLQYGSVRMDLWILWRTLLMMLGGSTIALQSVPRWAVGRGWVSEMHIRVVGAARFLVPRHDIASGGGHR